MTKTDAQPTCYLPHRSVLRISGADMFDFLQNLITNDMRLLSAEKALYACMLTPQGRFLHDFFISIPADGNGVLLECETDRRADLIKRFSMFKLRSKVVIEDCHGAFHVHTAATAPAGTHAFADPRMAELGWRFYADAPIADAADSTAWRDWRIARGIPEGTPDLEVEGDTVAHANLDRLNAVSWNKGCYLGQEITAMTQNRGVAKKRMAIVSGQMLKPGVALTQNGHAVGDIRSVNSAEDMALAVIKTAAIGQTIDAGGNSATATLPAWLTLENA